MLGSLWMGGQAQCRLVGIFASKPCVPVKESSQRGFGAANRFLKISPTECKLIQPLWRTVWRFLKKLKLELPYNPAIPLLGIYPEKTIIQKESCTTMFIAALLTIARTQKQPKCPSTDEWVKKMWHIYTMEYYSAIKRNEIELSVVRWMDLEIVV